MLTPLKKNCGSQVNNFDGQKTSRGTTKKINHCFTENCDIEQMIIVKANNKKMSCVFPKGPPLRTRYKNRKILNQRM